MASDLAGACVSCVRAGRRTGRAAPFPISGVQVDQDSVVSLIKDLSAKLSAVAEEFGNRADRMNEAGRPAAAPPSDTARRLIEERRLRRRFMSADLFHEPAWDMLLALYLAQHEGRVMNVKTLVAAADAPVTTSQRWIDHLGKLGLVTRVVDPIDRRRIEVSLSESGLKALEGYLAAVG